MRTTGLVHRDRRRLAAQQAGQLATSTRPTRPQKKATQRNHMFQGHSRLGHRGPQQPPPGLLPSLVGPGTPGTGRGLQSGQRQARCAWRRPWPQLVRPSRPLGRSPGPGRLTSRGRRALRCLGGCANPLGAAATAAAAAILRR